jgi:enolase
VSEGARLVDLTLRGILDSRGTVTVEAEVALDVGVTGRGSAPVAIARGRRERRPVPITTVGRLTEGPVLAAVRGALIGRAWIDQAAFDGALETLAVGTDIGANVTLALSLAFCRAGGRRSGVPLHRQLADGAGHVARMPHLLVNVFSGGIHGLAPGMPFQQIMLVVEGPSLPEAVGQAAAIYAAVEAGLSRRGHTVRHSASSGLLVPTDPDTLLGWLSEEIAHYATGSTRISLGFDVAAEHLRTADGRYAVGTGDMTSKELVDFLLDLTRRYAVRYVEDPFDPDDRDAWPMLAERLDPTVLVFGDDVFATSEAYVDRTLARGMVVKPSQAGTVTSTLRAVRAARAAGLQLCVSHRSGETEDTAMCDLAVGLGAEFIKIGGPRRGDRVAKYNQLLRLADGR